MYARLCAVFTVHGSNNVIFRRYRGGVARREGGGQTGSRGAAINGLRKTHKYLYTNVRIHRAEYIKCMKKENAYTVCVCVCVR